MAEVTGSLPILVDADAGNIHFPQIITVLCCLPYTKMLLPLERQEKPLWL